MMVRNLEDPFSRKIILTWTAGFNATRFGWGCKYHLDAGSSVRAKINNASQLNLGYQQKLRERNLCAPHDKPQFVESVYVFFNIIFK
jgi:hypothetical protein